MALAALSFVAAGFLQIPIDVSHTMFFCFQCCFVICVCTVIVCQLLLLLFVVGVVSISPLSSACVGRQMPQND